MMSRCLPPRTQALNVLMLKMLENSNRTYAFMGLLMLTRAAPQELRHRTEDAGRFFDLAVKCLIKISKALSDDLQVQCISISGNFTRTHTARIFVVCIIEA